MKRYRIIAMVYAILLFGGLLGSLLLTGHFAADYQTAEGNWGDKTEPAAAGCAEALENDPADAGRSAGNGRNLFYRRGAY